MAVRHLCKNIRRDAVPVDEIHDFARRFKQRILPRVAA